MANGGDDPQLRVAWGNTSISAKGPVVVAFLMWLLLIAAITYSGYRQEVAIYRLTEVSLGENRARAAEHVAITVAQDRTSCALLMTPEQRNEFRHTYRPGAWKAWCPWMTAE